MTTSFLNISARAFDKIERFSLEFICYTFVRRKCEIIKRKLICRGRSDNEYKANALRKNELNLRDLYIFL